MGIGTNHEGQHKAGKHREGRPARESKTQPAKRGKAVGRASVPDNQGSEVHGLIARAAARLAGKKKG